MTNIIVVFQKIEEARAVRSLLVKNGYSVANACCQGAQALDLADEMNGGIVVCGYKYGDMLFGELKDSLPPGFEMLLIASKSVLAEETDGSIVSLEMPLKVHDMLSTLEMMAESQERRKRERKNTPRVRTEGEQQVVNQAKAVLMERNHMTEPEAFRYIQKCSMDRAVNIVETSQMILTLMNR